MRRTNIFFFGLLFSVQFLNLVFISSQRKSVRKKKCSMLSSSYNNSLSMSEMTSEMFTALWTIMCRAYLCVCGHKFASNWDGWFL